MTLPRAQRIQYKRLLANLTDQPDWDFQGMQILFEDFGLDFDTDPFSGTDYASLLAKLSDEMLEEMYRIATGTAEQKESMERSSDVWRDGQLRLFISHLSDQKRFVMQVSEALERHGIHGFVAHEHLPNEQNWGESLKDALRSMHAFVSLVHPEFGESIYCSQEIGWAMGRNVPMRSIRLGENPPGFAASLQSPDLSSVSTNPWAVADHILEWLSGVPEVAERLTSSLITALGDARSFDHAGKISRAIVRADSLSDEDWINLGVSFGNNRQAYDSGTAKAALEPFFERHGRHFPPQPF